MKKIIKACGFHCIKINHLGVRFGEQIVLSDVNLHVHCNSLLAIVGKNGAGKSTLMRALLGDVKHTGTIEFRDTKDGHMEKLRIGYVPQNLNVEKNSPISVYDLIASYQFRFPVFLAKRRKIYEQIQAALSVFEAGNLIDRKLCNLSGGQLQRVLLSMAIMNKPHLLLLDEPVSGVDINGMELFYKTITRLKEEYDLAVILISHDLEYVRKYADQVVLIDQSVLASGTPKEVFATRAFHEIFGINEVAMPQSEEHSKAEEKTKAVRIEHYDASYRGKDQGGNC